MDQNVFKAMQNTLISGEKKSNKNKWYKDINFRYEIKFNFSP